MTGDTWERKACEGCGHVRRVKVTPAAGTFPAFWSRQCGACELEREARYLLDLVTIKRRKAAEIRARRLRS